jgi:2-oxo-3-hexenedioate decarboxylase
MLNQNEITALADELHQARTKLTEIGPLGEKLGPRFELTDAYKIQTIGIQKRLESHETLVGMKMGLTSEAKRKQMNLSSPIYGFLTQEMLVQKNFEVSKGIHPKIEPEIGVRLSKDIIKVITLEEAPSYVESIFPALEILDSRYRGFKYFSLPDVVADNSSSAYAVLGEETLFSEWLKKSKNLAELPMIVKINGDLKQSVVSREISGHPLQSIVEMSRLCAQYGQVSKKGWIVLLGAAAPAIALEKGMNVELEIESLGKCKVEAC